MWAFSLGDPALPLTVARYIVEMYIEIYLRLFWSHLLERIGWNASWDLLEPGTRMMYGVPGSQLRLLTSPQQAMISRNIWLQWNTHLIWCNCKERPVIIERWGKAYTWLLASRMLRFVNNTINLVNYHHLSECVISEELDTFVNTIRLLMTGVWW